MRPLTVLAVTLIVAGAVGLWPAAVAQAHPRSAYCYRPFDIQLLNLINNFRANHNVEPPLKLSQSLSAAAQHYSRDLAINDYVPDAQHHDSENKVPEDRMRDHGHVFDSTWSAGENVFYGNASPRAAFDGWKASTAGHRETMLRADFRAIGISRAYKASSTWDYYWTADFSSTRDAAAVPC
jgi:uncharacterized protein YkwD